LVGSVQSDWLFKVLNLLAGAVGEADCMQRRRLSGQIPRRESNGVFRSPHMIPRTGRILVSLARSTASSLVCINPQRFTVAPLICAFSAFSAFSALITRSMQPHEQRASPTNDTTLHGARLWSLIGGLYLAVYLVGLDLSMLSTVGSTHQPYGRVGTDRTCSR
jgi:hypothetical protein